MRPPTSLLTELPAIIAAGRGLAAEAVQRAEAARLEHNVLRHGNNLDGLARLVASGSRAKLVYLDPPFDSKADYRSRIQTRDDAGVPLALEMLTYTDRWAGGTAEYLRMLVPRLVLARELLTDDGTICVHLDWHSSHYVRTVLDELFGREHFVNSLVWSYRTGGAARTSAVPRKHDDLLIYRNTEAMRVTPLYERQYLDKPFMGSRQDAQGRHYVDTILRDVLEGEVNLVESGDVRVVSVRPVLNLSTERTGYATQKPEGLLELLLRWFTTPGDLVIDPFGGSGTTAAAAHRLGRRWVSMDASARSLVVARARLDALAAEYRVETDGQDAVEAARATITIEDGRCHLHEVALEDPSLETLNPARNTAKDALARLRSGTGVGLLAGWHVWRGDSWRGGERLAGAWRANDGTLPTTLSLDRSDLAEDTHPTDLVVELVDLVGNRSHHPIE
ncbi:MAG: DNA methyltransferase [Leucobacter sp.]